MKEDTYKKLDPQSPQTLEDHQGGLESTRFSLSDLLAFGCYQSPVLPASPSRHTTHHVSQDGPSAT